MGIPVFKKKNINFIIYFLLLAFFGIIIVISLFKKFYRIEGYTDAATQYAAAVASGASYPAGGNTVKQLNLTKSPGQF